MIRKILFVLVAMLPVLAAAQKNVVDEIVWVVGDEPILLSDIEEVRISSELPGSDPVDNPYCTIPEQIALQKLYLHQAELDSIEVSEGDVIRAVDQRINYLIQQYGSREAVEVFARKKISQLREQYKKMEREKEMMFEVQRKLVGGVSVTPAEVREYFKEMPEDSLPFVPTQVEVQIITSQPRVSREEVERIEGQLREFARRVTSGETEFSTLAKFYSQDGSARDGGELDYAGRNQWVPEFANVAFSLTDPKKVSKVVKTEFGYHIIQLIDKKGDLVKVRHILLKPEIEESEYQRCLTRLDSIAADIKADKFSFDIAAQELSEDKDTRYNRGIMANLQEETNTLTSRFQMKDLPQDVAKVVEKMQVGEISPAFRMTNAKGQTVCAIVKLKNRIDGHRANMTEDFQVLKNVVISKKREEKLEKWIKDKIASTYVRISPDWRGCDFKYKGWIK